MSFSGLILTNLGRNELIRAEMGKQFNISHIVLGDGTYTGSYTAIQKVVNPVMEISVTHIYRDGEEIYVECDFNSTDIPTAFYFREIGIVANDVLCYYDNAREDPEYIDPSIETLVKQKRMRFVLTISSEVNVNVDIKSSLYALASDLEDTIARLEDAIDGTIKVKKSENADKATQLATARNLQVNLESKSSVAFNGTKDIVLGVIGVLPLTQGGTGATTKEEVLVNLGITALASELNVLDGMEATTKELNLLKGATVKTTELNYLSGVKSNIQTQLDTKSPLASPVFTGTPQAPTASAGTSNTQVATTAFVQTAIGNAIAASDAMIVKGTIGTNGTVTALPTTYKTGWTYRVVTEGTYAGQTCEIGDLIIALVDRNGSGNVNADWCVAQTNINGAITGIKSGDAYIGVSQSGSVVTIVHKDVTRTDTTSTAKPNHGATFTAIDSVTSDAKGHITGVNVKTVTLPTYSAMTGATADAAGKAGLVPVPTAGKQSSFLRGDGTWVVPTDTKATQTNTTTDADYRVVLSANANDTTETNTLRKSTNFRANPSTGAFYAKGYDRNDITGQTLDVNTLTLSAGSPEIIRYIEKTSGGASNITNIPVTGQPFTLDVELIRWASTTDYITKQTFVSVGAKANEYVRYCTSGTWDSSWTKRVFTDNNTTYSKATSSALGLVKIGYTESGKNYPVELDSDGKMFVNVPWTDNNTDTKNTAGSTNSSSKLFLIGATSQAANPQTYSHDTVYIGTDGHLYTNSKQAVNLSDTQALTNKTYNGYTLKDACAKGVYNLTAKGTLAYDSSTAQTLVPTLSALAFWNGAYKDTASNLAYCAKGAFGSIVTKNTGDYVPISGGVTLTGNIVQKNLTLHDGVQSRTVITMYDDEDASGNYGSELLIGGAGNTFIGGGESVTSLRNALIAENATLVTNEGYSRTGESMYVIADSNIYFETNCNTIANRKVAVFNNSGNLIIPGTVTASAFKGTADVGTKVTGTLTNPTSATAYAIPFHSSVSTGSKALLNNDGFRYKTLEGTADANGYALLLLGNNTASGTAKNKYGGILGYGKGAYYTQLDFGTQTANRTITFPDATGTVALTSSNVASATKATQDSAGQQINKTYIKGLSVSGKTITYTKGDGTTGTITTQDTNTTYSKATSSALGLVKIGYTESGKNYPVELDSDGKMFVNVPWTDNNTTYTLSSFGITATKDELNKLDGCTATVTELNYVDGVTSNIQTQLNGKLSTGGGTVTGNITMKKGTPKYVAQNTSVTRGTVPSSNAWDMALTITDSAGSTLGGIEHGYKNNGELRMNMLAYKSDGSTNAQIAVGFDSNGNWFTYAPTPATGDSSTKIATTSFVNNAMKELKTILDAVCPYRMTYRHWYNSQSLTATYKYTASAKSCYIKLTNPSSSSASRSDLCIATPCVRTSGKTIKVSFTLSGGKTDADSANTTMNISGINSDNKITTYKTFAYTSSGEKSYTITLTDDLAELAFVLQVYSTSSAYGEVTISSVKIDDELVYFV